MKSEHWILGIVAIAIVIGAVYFLWEDEIEFPEKEPPSGANSLYMYDQIGPASGYIMNTFLCNTEEPVMEVTYRVEFDSSLFSYTGNSYSFGEWDTNSVTEISPGVIEVTVTSTSGVSASGGGGFFGGVCVGGVQIEHEQVQPSGTTDNIDVTNVAITGQSGQLTVGEVLGGRILWDY